MLSVGLSYLLRDLSFSPRTLTAANENYGFVEGEDLEFSLSETEGISC